METAEFITSKEFLGLANLAFSTVVGVFVNARAKRRELRTSIKKDINKKKGRVFRDHLFPVEIDHLRDKLCDAAIDALTEIEGVFENRVVPLAIDKERDNMNFREYMERFNHQAKKIIDYYRMPFLDFVKSQEAQTALSVYLENETSEEAKHAMYELFHQKALFWGERITAKINKNVGRNQITSKYYREFFESAVFRDILIGLAMEWHKLCDAAEAEYKKYRRRPKSYIFRQD